MKRQMKMTTSKEPQRKFMGGRMIKKLVSSVANAVKDKSAKAPASEPAAAPSSAGSGRSGRGLMGKIAQAVQAVQAVQAAAGKKKASSPTPTAAAPTSIPAAPASSGRKRGFRGLGRAIASAVNKKKKQEEVPGMKKGGAVRKDKMGRAMKKTTADGCAIRGKTKGRMV
jgi:hypothetical protein